ncbi:hypothetical protein BBJ66_29915 [Rhizobium sp. RSm-3]|uniref:hypothetical protein n=1 Tax=Rhizobium sp. RMa-01 TaxID=2494255 RepID=UPI0008DB03B5|nr:hypothetical protein [Rhizobium sp. RMa-01]OHV22396.1 hypothetical protein BBJ66_29915 [Rhizobium sp. RSm-3]
MSRVLDQYLSIANLAAGAGTLDVAATPAPHSLIPVLVTGIQPPRVGAVNDSCNAQEFLAPKDLGALDSCDKHRNEGGETGGALYQDPSSADLAATLDVEATPARHSIIEPSPQTGRLS